MNRCTFPFLLRGKEQPPLRVRIVGRARTLLFYFRVQQEKKQGVPTHTLKVTKVFVSYDQAEDTGQFRKEYFFVIFCF